MPYKDHLRTVGLTTLETRILRADMIEVYIILRGFIILRATRGVFMKFFKKRVNFDVGKFNLGNRVCDDWNRLPGWVVSGECVHEFMGI